MNSSRAENIHSEQPGPLNSAVVAAAKLDAETWAFEQGLTLEDLADFLRIHPKTLSNYLNDHRPMPVEVLIKLCRRAHKYRSLHVLCHALGHLATPTGAVAGGDIAALLDSIGTAHKEFGEAMRQVIQDAADGRIDELAKGVREIRESAVALNDVLAQLEAAATAKRAAR